MNCGIKIIILPLLSLGGDQARSVTFMANESANIFAEHVDSITNYNKIKAIHAFVDKLSHVESNILYYCYSYLLTLYLARYGLECFIK